MKKILFLTIFIVFALGMTFADTCTQTFSESGQDDDPTTVTIIPADITCTGGGTITGITLNNTAGAFTSSYCGSWYDFNLYVDYVPVILNGCQTDFDETTISSSFDTIIVSSNDLDDYSDGVTITFDLVIEYTPPACVQPTVLISSNITASGADLGWTEGGSATSWNIELGLTGFSPTGTATQSGVTNPYSYGSLAPASTYDWYIQADCGVNGTSVWVGPNTFTTECLAAALPISEDVDSVTPPALPTCWSMINDTGNSSAYVKTQSSNSYSIPNSFTMYNTSVTSGNLILISPESSATTADTRVRFWAKASYGNNNLLVGTITDPTDPDTFTLIQTIALDATYTEYTVNLSGTDNYIAMKHGLDASYDYNYIDDITWEEIPSCLEPSDLVSSNITTSGADIGWTSVDSFFDVYIVPTGDPAPVLSTTPTVNDNSGTSYSWTGGSENTIYDWYVRTDCGEDNTDVSVWVGPISFSTLCNTITTFPYVEGFDNSWVGDPAAPECWSVVNNDADNYTWSQSNTYISPTHSGTYAAHGMGSNDDYLITPQLVLSDDYRIKWWDVVESSSNNNTYDILVSTTTNEITSFTTNLGTYDCTNTTWTEHILDLNAYNGETIYIAFHQTYSAATYYGFGIDDVTVEEIPNCLEPSDLTSGSITTNSAALGWTESGTAEYWNIEWGLAGFTQGLGLGTTTIYLDPTFALTELTAATSYDWYVRADCGDGNLSPWSGPNTFSTLVTNDECATAEIIGEVVEQAFDNTSATTSNVGSHYINKDIWYVYTASSNGLLDVDLCGSDFDTKLAIWDGCDGTELSYDDDGCPSVTRSTSSMLEDIPVVLNEEYFIQVGAFGTNFGTGVITISLEDCVDPSNQTEENISQTSVDLGWTENGGSTIWEFKYGLEGFTVEIGTSTLYTNPHTLTGLTADTPYDWYIRSDCSGDEYSAWIGPSTFTTLADFPAPSNLTATNIGFDQADLGWTEEGTARSWNIEYGIQGFEQGTGIDITETGLNPITVTGLSINTSYDFYVQAYRADSDIVSAWAGPFTFSATDGKAVNPTPADNASGIIKTATSLDWDDVIGAEGFLIDIGTTSGGTELVDHTTIETFTSSEYTYSSDWSANTEYFWTVYTVYDDGVIIPVSRINQSVKIVNSSDVIQEIQGDEWSFITACDPFTLPFAEDFSGTQSCWTVLNENGDSDLWNMDYTSNAYSTPEVAMMYTDYNSGNNDDYLITPQITLTGNEILEYWYRVQSSGEPNDFEILLSTTGAAPEDFTNTLMSNTSFSNTSYEQNSIDISAYSGNVFIAFHVPDGGLDGWRLYIDDVSIRSASSEKDITAYSFAEQTGAATIDADNHTVAVEVALGTSVTALVSTFELSAGATAFIDDGIVDALIEQESGTTANDFTEPVTYTIVAEDASTQDWIISVTVATSQSNENDILAYSFAEQAGAAVIDDEAHTVNIDVAFGTDVTALVATFTVSDLATAYIEDGIAPPADHVRSTHRTDSRALVEQESGITANDFTNSVDYTIEAEDGTQQIWTVTVTVIANGGPDTFGYTWANELDPDGPTYSWIEPTPVAPSTPANVQITNDGTDVVITWDAVTGADSYVVYSSTDPAGISPAFAVDGTGAFVGEQWTAPSPGDIYFYKVAADGIINNVQPLLGDDNVIGPIPIGFSFDFYGTSYSEFSISSNGFIGFGSQTSSSASNYAIPSTSGPENIIAWFWDDLDPADNPNEDTYVYYENLVGTNDMLISFVHYHEYTGAGTGELTAQVILHTNGDITIQYKEFAGGIDMTGNTVGIENAAGDDGLQYQYNTNYLQDMRAIKFYHPVDENGATHSQPYSPTLVAPHEIVRDNIRK